MPNSFPINELSEHDISFGIREGYHISYSNTSPIMTFPDGYVLQSGEVVQSEPEVEVSEAEQAREEIRSSFDTFITNNYTFVPSSRLAPRQMGRVTPSPGRTPMSIDSTQLIERSDDEDIPDFEEDEDMMFMDEPPRNTTAEDFPEYKIPAWSSDVSREHVVNQYFSHLEYRLRWIFYREEKEGFRRRSHGVRPFNRQDFLDRLRKQPKPHELNTDTSTFYDWNIGATDFILRLENFDVDGRDCMRIHIIYKPTMQEIGFQDRMWCGESYNEIHIEWAHA